MIDQNEIAEVAKQLGVGSAQIIRDHFISHILAALSDVLNEPFTFVGGTALCRSVLNESRVSEDIDLSVINPLQQLGRLREELPPRLQRDWGEITFEVVLDKRDHASCFINSPSARVKCELVDWGTNRKCWPTTEAEIPLRYSDLPDTVTLTLPTAEAFAGMKGGAFHDRHQPRDLFDLAGLARIGAINERAESILKCTHGSGFIVGEFQKLPFSLRNSWHTELDHQTRNPSDPDACAAEVLEALKTFFG